VNTRYVLHLFKHPFPLSQSNSRIDFYGLLTRAACFKNFTSSSVFYLCRSPFLYVIVRPPTHLIIMSYFDYLCISYPGGSWQVSMIDLMDHTIHIVSLLVSSTRESELVLSPLLARLRQLYSVC
jgi:hypothetical protein